jgi:hypothetical protein
LLLFFCLDTKETKNMRGFVVVFKGAYEIASVRSRKTGSLRAFFGISLGVDICHEVTAPCFFFVHKKSINLLLHWLLLLPLILPPGTGRHIFIGSPFPAVWPWVILFPYVGSDRCGFFACNLLNILTISGLFIRFVVLIFY